MEIKNTNTPSLPSTERPDQPTLTQAEVTAAATNSPALTDDSFEYGGRTFKVLHLDYDSYLEFMAFLQPLFEGVAATFASKRGVSLPGIELPDLNSTNAVSHLMKFCKKDLPAMACIVCNQQALKEKNDSLKVSPEWIKEHAEDPFEVLNIVLKQVNKNQMIKKFADFFVRILPIAGMVMGTTQTPPTE